MGILSQIVQSVVTVVKKALESISGKTENVKKNYSSSGSSSSSSNNNSYARWIDERMERLRKADETNKNLISSVLGKIISIGKNAFEEARKVATKTTEPEMTKMQEESAIEGEKVPLKLFGNIISEIVSNLPSAYKYDRIEFSEPTLNELIDKLDEDNLSFCELFKDKDMVGKLEQMGYNINRK